MVDMADRLSYKIVGAICVFFIVQMFYAWSKLESMDEKKLTIIAEVASLERQRNDLQLKIMEFERESLRLGKRVEQLEVQVRDRIRLFGPSRASQPTIYFITPTHRRPAQKADLTRLSQTLAQVPNLFWLLVEDAPDTSPFIQDIIARTKLPHAHIAVATRSDQKLKLNDPNWILPRGVEQRNAALEYLRRQMSAQLSGAVYFGDDDNSYDWRVFEEIRSVRRVGVWPVGIVGGLLAETPILHGNGTIRGFNAVWKPERPFPIDMASFAVNLTLVLKNPQAQFKYDVPRGYQESQFLTSLGATLSDLEPKAEMCTKVFVWHTRTEKTVMSKTIEAKYLRRELTALELEALGS